VEPLSTEMRHPLEKSIFSLCPNIKKTMKIAICIFATRREKVLNLFGTAVVPTASAILNGCKVLPVLDSREMDIDGFASDVWV
jgi:hypothetical protein